MKDASRRIGRVIAWAGAIASLTIATPVLLMLLSAQDLPEILSAEAPIAAYLGATAGPLTAALVSVGVVAALFNNLIAAGMGLSRFIYATGRDGYWAGPINRVLAQLHPRLKSPLTATVLLCLASVLIALLGEKVILIVLAGEDVFNTFLISLAVLSGRRRGLVGANFRAPLHPLIPAFGLTLTVVFIWTDWLDADAGRPSIVLLSAVFLGAVAYYWLRLRRTMPAFHLVTDVVLTPETGD
jgi:fructoselysine transporter